ncbi:MAG: hypothetical protein WBG62_19515 [Cyclobacteriaceae bacterium]
MRKTTLVSAVLALLIALLPACGKEEVNPYARDYEYGGEAMARKNDVEWKAEVRATQAIEPEFGMSLNLYLFNGATLLENLYVYKIPTSLGKFDITITEAIDENNSTGCELYTMIDGDVLDDIYYVDTAKVNYITIEEFDADAATIRGTFQVHTLIVKDGRFTDSEPEVRFTAGEYETEVNPEWFE